MSLDDLTARALAGDQRSLARLATILENRSDQAAAVRRFLAGRDGKAHVVGVTGPPGSGKSSLLARVAGKLSSDGKTVAIIAVDPTSPLSGGATLGDRIRMSEASLKENVFVRSVASRTRMDGLAPAAPDMVRLFDAAGFDYVILETVGSGQNQVEVTRLVHTVVLVEAPGAGDSVQMLKAGIMELADIYAVTKADLPGAHVVARELRSMLSLDESSPYRWQPRIVLCSSETGDGITKVIEAIDAHAEFLAQSEGNAERDLSRAHIDTLNEVHRIVETAMSGRPDLVREVAEGLCSPEEAASRLLDSLNQSPRSPV